MLSDTLAEGLGRYRIGDKIRALRQQKKLKLKELGAHTGLSTATLSKIERGQLHPTLPTLLRIALVFGVGLEHFFVESAPKPLLAVVRKKDRVRLPDRPGQKRPAYFFESLDFPVTERRMEAYYAEFPERAEASAPHRHDGVELVYVLDGALCVTIGGASTTLGEGDALYFDSSVPHTYARAGATACKAIVVVTGKR